MAPNLQALLDALRAPEPAPSPAPEPAFEAPPSPPPAPPPGNDLSLFLQARIEMMEQKLQLAQHEALRANLLLTEREEAQRKARLEVEELFRSIREQSRAAGYDSALREQFASAQRRIEELEERLGAAAEKAAPAEEAASSALREEGQRELEERLRARVPDLPTLAAVMGRVSDLERRLEEAHEERRRERSARLEWEASVFQAMKQLRSQWQKAGGPELLVEAALESMVDGLREREDLQRELAALISALRDEPPDSAQRPHLRARLEACRSRIDDVQKKLDGQMAIVQAWTERETKPRG